MAHLDEDAMIRQVLSSMGLASTEYDDSVVTVLAEYARRYASEILCDSMDYAEHAQRTEIEPQDVKLAVNLSDVSTIFIS